MSSSASNFQYLPQPQQHHHAHFDPNHYMQTYLPTPQSANGPSFDSHFIDEAALSQFVSKLQERQGRPSKHNKQASYCMKPATTHPDIRIQSSSPLPPAAYVDTRQDSVYSGNTSDVFDWQRSNETSMGGNVVAPRPLKRARSSHQRTPSASTVGSNGPASPYTQNVYNPNIANTDYSPNSPAQYADQAHYSKALQFPQPDASLWNPGYYIPNLAAQTTSAHLATKQFANDYHNFEDYQDFYSHPSMSSHGNNTPTTPQSGAADNMDQRQFSMNGEFRQMNSNPALFRTESSQAYESELYNPPMSYSSAPAMSSNKRNSEYLTPHRNLVTERLQTAEAARSASPRSATSRERSPFRVGSPLAPVGDWNPEPAANMQTAATMRQQQKQAELEAELEAHQPPAFRREATKTISPKDALLDYNGADEQPLFQDSAPTGYKQHNGGMDWQNNFAGASFGNLATYPTTQNPHMTNFRATSADQDFQYGSGLLPPGGHAQNQIQSTPLQAPAFNAVSKTDTNPTFPATLTSMESSVSENNGPPLSSQESLTTSAPKRPADTRAGTGTYTCIYHGCTQRFESHSNLQKHKREYHRANQQQLRESTTPGEEDGSVSPSASAHSSESPEPSTEGMTSAALLARNSQAGPHKCTRTNPSTNKPCNTIFSRPYDLTRHEDTIHNNRKQKVKCPMCREEKTFSRNDALTRHMRVVHPEVESFGKRGGR